MQITTSKEDVFWLVDELLARWRSKPKGYPFNRPDAIIPQDLVPIELRADKRTLANWYLAICNHMKGRVNSTQAFLAYIEMWKQEPQFFDPDWVALQNQEIIEGVYERFIATDKRACAKAHILNSRRLKQHYKGDARNILKNATSYDEAIARIMNKVGRLEREAGNNDPGFFGFRHKMVSMFVYFMDWEGFIKKRFPYPSPADIQNFRIGIASLGIRIERPSPRGIRNHETISAPWREVVLQYIVERKQDPIDVADVLWLFSNIMCGNSPLTSTLTSDANGTGLFDADSIPPSNTIVQLTKPKYLEALQETCLNCFLLSRCSYVIPAAPYYESGIIELRVRPKIELVVPQGIVTEPTFGEVSEPEHQHNLFPDE